MGGACSTVEEADFEARYYFNDTNNINQTGIEQAPMNINNVQMEESVSLSIEIKNVDITSEHRVELITKEENKGIPIIKSAGFTERRAKNNNDNTIIFQQFFTIPYYFEKQQLLEFRVYFNNYDNELIQTSLGSIMGSRGQTFKKKLSNGEDIYIKGSELKKSSKEIIFDIIIQGNSLVGCKFRYSIINKGTDQKPDNKKIYDSEVKAGKKNVPERNQLNFMRCKIPLMYLKTGGNNNDNIISIEFFDIIHKREIGNYQGYFSNIMNSNNFEIFLFNNIKAIINCRVESHPTFISYLRSGINTIKILHHYIIWEEA